MYREGRGFVPTSTDGWLVRASDRWVSGRNSVGRVAAFQAACRRFDPGRPLQALVVQWTERECSKLRAAGSIPVEGSTPR